MKKTIVFCLATLLFITCGVIGAALGWSLRASVTLNQIPEYSYALWREVDSGDQEVDFTNVAAGDWTRVCFLGPYNENSSKALGFNWRITEYTNVLSSDGHNVIIFANDSAVIDFIVQNRRYGDFHTMSGRCVDRANSRLHYNQKLGSYHQQ
ncbi:MULTISPECIES: hypothetical protein [unclassified Agarivorans]|uniref:hypothetical protein n=1 Tax=unclassified Agarivorans TaxID=2636026 RepID=UPI0026E1C6F0|nr:MULTISPECIES: hypothetical protein [unclassified Agarivorans]MDO6684570.1 hypothetical protein [Agarivorans sp. 3_MG-2023]MDO6714735.1 hypothetical protein [Agarivorans sp. 2_MG-2023]